MNRTLRRIGIAIGSLVIAWLAVSLVVGGPTSSGSLLIALVTVVLGGLVYQDIMRRERPTS